MKIRSEYLMLVVFAVALLVRLGWIGTFLGQDEVYYVGYANDIIDHRPYTSAYSPLFYFFLAPFVLLFNNSEILIHAFIAVLGALNVALVYYMGSKFASKWVGVIAAILLMFNTTHWFYSDFAMLDMPVALFSTLAFYFYWSGYTRKSNRGLLLAVVFGSISILTKYGFFAPVAMLGYLLLFDRKNLKNKNLLISIILPFIVFGLWMAYFIEQQGWLWNWWSNYIQGGTGLASPYYQYAAATWYEFLLPIPALFVILTSAYLMLKKKIKYKHSWVAFLAAFALLSVYSLFNTTTLELQAALGTVALVLLSLALIKNKFYRFSILYVAAVFIFYSAIALKFPRYVLPALPVLYILVGGLIDSVRKNKFYFLASIAVMTVFIISNFVDTTNKLTLDREINSVKHDVQQYVIDNSQSCSQVYSKTWYGFYYLRTRISDLPKDITTSSCNCPPEYVISEGTLDQTYASQLIKEKVFTGSATQYAVDKNGFRSYVNALTPLEVYRIPNACISSIALFRIVSSQP